MTFHPIIKKLFLFFLPIILILILKDLIITTFTLLNDIHEVNQLKSKVDARKKENQFLSQQIYFVGKNEYIEAEARKKLGLVKADEQIVITNKPPASLYINPLPEKDPWEKWLDLFL